MKKTVKTIVFVSFMSVTLAIFAQGSSSDVALKALFDSEWQYRLERDPMLAHQMERPPEEYKPIDMSPAALAKQQVFYQSLAQRLSQIDFNDLSVEQQVNYQIFRDQVQTELSAAQFATHQVPFNSDSGFYSAFSRVQSIFQFKTEDDYNHYLQLLSYWPEQVSQHIQNMQAGLDRGFSQPRAILDDLPSRVSSYIAKKPTQSVFYKPFKRFPKSMDDATKQRLKREAQDTISQDINNGYQQLADFFEKEYLPRARTSLGASALPDGTAFYQDQIRHYTTLNMTADEIHQIGLKEVARIREEMQRVIDSVGFKGEFKDFLTFLRTEPQFYAQTEEELLAYASRIAKRMDAQLPKLFKRLPRLPYGVEPVPSQLAPNYTTGRYVSAPKGSTEPGYYWVNTYALDTRPLYELEALTLHEAVPGHHLQIALSQELDNLPNFRQYSYLSAFGEGWGLYSEYLGLEAGFYQDPYSNFGRLTYEMWRAVRLVVDTGIHAKGWSRAQANDYLANNTALSLHNVRTEIDRYISWPAQALSYKLGELTIKRLRKEAEKKLGSQFDIRAFHDVVLSQGSVPLNVLEQQVRNYIEATLKQ